MYIMQCIYTRLAVLAADRPTPAFTLELAALPEQGALRQPQHHLLVARLAFGLRQGLRFSGVSAAAADVDVAVAIRLPMTVTPTPSTREMKENNVSRSRYPCSNSMVLASAVCQNHHLYTERITPALAPGLLNLILGYSRTALVRITPF